MWAPPAAPGSRARAVTPSPAAAQAGFTLLEILIVVAIAMVTGTLVYRITRSSLRLYDTQVHVTERGFSGLRALDDMAIEIARAGYGLGEDVGPVFPGTLDGLRVSSAITLRSNPSGAAAALQEDLVENGQLVKVDAAPLFTVGDEVLLADLNGTVERAQVAKATPEALAFLVADAPPGKLESPFLTAFAARVLKVREVGFSLKTDATGTTVIARKATGQAEQIVARYAGALAFDYLDEEGAAMDLGTIGPGSVPASVRIALQLRPNPGLPLVTVSPLTLRVALETQSATIAFDPYAFHRVGLAGVVGQDAASADKKVGMHGWRKSDPRF